LKLESLTHHVQHAPKVITKIETEMRIVLVLKGPLADLMMIKMHHVGIEVEEAISKIHTVGIEVEGEMTNINRTGTEVEEGETKTIWLGMTSIWNQPADAEEDIIRMTAKSVNKEITEDLSTSPQEKLRTLRTTKKKNLKCTIVLEA